VIEFTAAEVVSSACSLTSASLRACLFPQA
jgi:hypothetical protein